MKGECSFRVPCVLGSVTEFLLNTNRFILSLYHSLCASVRHCVGINPCAESRFLTSTMLKFGWEEETLDKSVKISFVQGYCCNASYCYKKSIVRSVHIHES